MEAALSIEELAKERNFEIKNSLDFSIFGDTSAFADIIDLKNSTVLECIDSYITNKARDKKSSMRQYKQLINHLNNIEEMNDIVLKPIVVCDIFWKQFHNYLLNKNLSPSTVDHLSSQLCAVLKWAAKYGAVVSPTLENCYLTHGKAPLAKPNISLTQDEVSRITYFDIDSLDIRPQLKKTLKLVRDQFVIACFIGQRYSDVRRITSDCFQDGVFRITQQKTGNKAVVDINKIAPYPSVIKRLLEKYDYCAPYPYTVINYNRHLHVLFKLAGFDEEIVHTYKVGSHLITKTFKKYELISSHTARRTMITNAVERGINTQEIKRASGHKSDNSFNGYICWNDL